MDYTDNFFSICMYVLEKVINLASMLWAYWYFRLLFVSGLVWLVFDIFEEVSNIYNDHREDWT